MNKIKQHTFMIVALVLMAALLIIGPASAQTTSIDLSVTKAVDNAMPYDGGTIVYTITATNNGADPATGVIVSDLLPTGVTYLSYVSDNVTSTYDSLTGAWTIGDLAAGTSANLNITATVVANTDGNSVTNTASISGNEVDPDTSNNSSSATINVRVNDLCATTGSISLPGLADPVTIWGYAPGDCSNSPSAQLPGPAIVANQGDALSITLHNNLAESSALLFQGQAMIPDTAGVDPLSAAPYGFTATNPGTFLYEAGLTPNGQHQVAMGMYGALIVRPSTPGQAYGDPSTAFTKEAVMVLSELDTALNSSATPATFDVRNYNPKYFLINGKAYPGTDPISVTAGDTLLLRYVNAGLQAHAMSTLGLSQTIIGQDGSPYTYSHKVVAETIATGQTLDTLVTIPAAAVNGSKFAIYDANMLLRNNTASSFGGMLTFLTASSTTGGGSAGPVTTNVAVSPNPANGHQFNASDPASGPVTLSATITPSNGATMTAAEYFVDAVGANGSGCAITGSLTNVSVSIPVSGGTAPCLDLTTLSSGNHTFYVHGQDSSGTPGPTWGAVASAVLNLDKVGPTTSALGLSPNPANGSASVSLTATGSDSASGNSNVTAAEYFIDPVGTPVDGSGNSMTVNIPAPTASLSATIPAATVSGLSEGNHTIRVHSMDVLGNWGALVDITLMVDRTGPTTSGVSAAPNPNNGSQGLNTSTPAVRVTASFSDMATGGSNIAAAEGFIDTIGTTGTGFVFVASDGSFNSPTESGYGDIPLAVIGALSNGNHTIYVHAKDAAGNWNNTLPYASTILVINKSLYFSTTGNANPPGVGGPADDADIYLWNGTAFSRVLDASNLGVPSSGGSNANVDGFDRVDANHFYMSFSADTTLPGLPSVQDEDIVYYNAGTWSVYFDGTALGLTSNAQDIDAFNISGGVLYFSTAGNTNPPTLAGCPAVGGTADDADIYSWNGTCFSRVLDVSVAPYSVPATANVDGFVRVDATHFYLSFVDDTTLPGLGTVQDEDVVYYNNGTWSTYFDGTGKGLTSNSLDIDAFDIP